MAGLVTEHRQFADAHDLETEIREVVSRNFKCAWWRGMAYGVVADVPTISLHRDGMKVLVDLYANAKGTLQWVILVTDDEGKGSPSRGKRIECSMRAFEINSKRPGCRDSPGPAWRDGLRPG